MSANNPDAKTLWANNKCGPHSMRGPKKESHEIIEESSEYNRGREN